MFIKKEIVIEHFSKPVKSYGRGRIIKKGLMLQRSLVKIFFFVILLQFFFFVFFFLVNKKMSDSTGSSFFCTRGRYLKISRKSYGSGVLFMKFVLSETLFQNLTDYWINTHHNNRKCF